MTTHSTRRRLQAVAVLALSSAMLLAGCGSDDEGGADAANASSASDAGNEGASAEPTDGTGGTIEGVDGEEDTIEGVDGTETTLLDDDITAARGTTPTEEVFSVQSPWNTSILDAAVAPDSEEMLEASRFRTLPGFDGQERNSARVDEGVYINTRAWTVPVVADGVPTTVTCRQERCGDGGEDITLDIPEDVDPDPLYDGWFTIFEPDSGTAYDLWRARREDDGTISYHFMRTWDLDGPGFNQPYVVGARGSGLPLFAGLIRPGELERGQINHALAISLPGPASDYFIQPASSTDGNNDREDALPEGARIRLRADFQIQQPIDNITGEDLPFRRAQRVYAQRIVQALQRFGAIVVDRAAVPTLYFQRIEREPGRQPLLFGWELQSLGLDDFEVVDFSGQRRYPFPPEGEVVDPADLELVDNLSGGDSGTSGTTTTSGTEDQ